MRPALLLLFFAFACGRQSEPTAWERCHEEQTRLLAECRPMCERTPIGNEPLDTCLDDCARRVYGKPIPICGAADPRTR